MVEGSRPTTRVAGSSSEMEENLRRERMSSFQSAHLLENICQYFSFIAVSMLERFHSYTTSVMSGEHHQFNIDTGNIE